MDPDLPFRAQHSSEGDFLPVSFWGTSLISSILTEQQRDLHHDETEKIEWSGQ